MTDGGSETEEREHFLEGAISIAAALAAGSRPIRTLYLRDDRPTPELADLERLASAQGVPVQRISLEQIGELANGRSHGGALALAGERRFTDIEGLVPAGGEGVVVMVDGVEDPFNFGSAVRSLYAAGVSGLVLRPRNWSSAAGIVARSSAGASERMPTAIVESPREAADRLRVAGFRVVAAARDRRSISLWEADLSGRVFLLLGGEKRGITRSFRDRADLLIHIPYGRPEAEALGTAAAAAIVGFELLRRRLAGGG